MICISSSSSLISQVVDWVISQSSLSRTVRCHDFSWAKTAFVVNQKDFYIEVYGYVCFWKIEFMTAFISTYWNGQNFSVSSFKSKTENSLLIYNPCFQLDDRWNAIQR